MESAYLYVRVSTDEQKKKGYSLPEQEDRLLKYCDHYGIQVKGIFREDFSAKDFNRPEWKKLVLAIKKNPQGESNYILFIKWDRFSRNIAYAYEMIGILHRYHTTAMAIDQPIDFSVPESTVMLAVYLSIPEAENGRRALNTANGIRRAKQMGRCPHRAPLGYINLAALNGKKYIALQQPEAHIIRWAFHQLAKNAYTIEEVRRMAVAKGLKCSKSNFWQLIHNPVYCGYVVLSSMPEDQQLIKAIHQPLVSEALFLQVQNVIGTKRRVKGKTDEIKSTFILKGYLTCPACGCKLSGSYSRGRNKRYPYYHCLSSCGTRVRADMINSSYIEQLQQLGLSKSASVLFELVLKDANIGIQKAEYLHERQLIQNQLGEQESVISKARQLFVSDKLKFDDFSELKKEYKAITGTLKREYDMLTSKLNNLDLQYTLTNRSFVDIFSNFKDLDLFEQKRIVNLIPPTSMDIQARKVAIRLSNTMSKILSSNTKQPISIT